MSDLASRAEKLSMFRLSADKKCPACGGAKSRLHWLCIPCQSAVNGTPENDVLTVACSAHVRAAEALISRARTAIHTTGA